MRFSPTKLELAMARQCVSIGDLCEKANIPRPTLSQARRGVRNPSPKTVGKIAAALGVDPAELVDLEERQ